MLGVPLDPSRRHLALWRFRQARPERCKERLGLPTVDIFRRACLARSRFLPLAQGDSGQVGLEVGFVGLLCLREGRDLRFGACYFFLPLWLSLACAQPHGRKRCGRLCMALAFLDGS
ncbi:hypothetical protein BD310DRAFT_654150 [Dichomitus squalens]|uniref:Uncharacterized protein n=1 Tax=Dichomitus squalens TaxID=114155 RepID=A0A4V2K7E4_9APHY|nr:hypothetical protein BD310DRAFT_654150 [Dichomitus squalens]